MTEQIISKDQFTLGATYLKMFLKKIEIEVEGNIVKVIQILDFGDETLAKSFAETLKKVYEEGI